MTFSVLITGARSGIGLEITRKLLATLTSGDHVFATCRDPTEAPDLDQLKAAHSNLHVLRLDVNDEQGYGRLVSEVQELIPSGQGLNVLINNAGVMGKWPLKDLESSHMMDVYRTNCVAPLLLAKAFLPLLKEAADTTQASTLGMSWKRACVLNINSRLGSVADNGSGGAYAYRASKVALNAVTRSLGIDLRPDHILVVSMDPGWVRTKMGGPNGKISPEESAARIISAMEQMTAEQTSTYVDHFGKPIPW